MKVIMIKDLKKVGKAGEIVEVSDGYGANFVIPQGYGKLLTDKSLAEYKEMKKQEAIHEEELKEAARKEAETLKSITLEFESSAGKNGYMCGTVSSKMIVEQLKKEHNISVDKRKFKDFLPINCFGVTEVKVELYHGVFGTIRVKVKEK